MAGAAVRHGESVSPLEIDEEDLKAAQKKPMAGRSYYTQKERLKRADGWVKKLKLKSLNALMDRALDFYMSALEEKEAEKTGKK